jgi:hypothetical protein
MSRSRPLPPPMWSVRIGAHHVAQRLPIEASRVKLPGASADHARLSAVRRVHSAAGVPPWKPCVRESLEHTAAKRLAPQLSRAA